MSDASNPPRFVGFWVRFAAFAIDTLIIVAVTTPLMVAIYGPELVGKQGFGGFWGFVIQVVLPFVAVIVFWRFRGATPGKMLFNARIVDASTLGPPSTGQLIGRYFAYIASTVVFFLGFIWIAIDARKQAWHDRLANTLVIYGKDK